MQYLWPFGAIKKETKKECAKWTHIFIFQTSNDYHLYSNRPLVIHEHSGAVTDNVNGSRV